MTTDQREEAIRLAKEAVLNSCPTGEDSVVYETLQAAAEAIDELIALARNKDAPP